MSYTADEIEKARKKVSHELDATDVNDLDGMPVQDIIAGLQGLLDETPVECRADVYLTLEVIGDCDDYRSDHAVEVTAYYLRPESDADVIARLNLERTVAGFERDREIRRKHQLHLAEIATLGRLMLKYNLIPNPKPAKRPGSPAEPPEEPPQDQ